MRRPEPLVLAAFAGIVLIGGANIVAVRFSNAELPPFFGAWTRFALAGLLLFGIVAVQRAPLPRGRALVGVALYGLFNFGASYAFLYWGLLGAPAALASVVISTVPLLTLVLAIAVGQERFRWKGMGGAALAIVGIAIVFSDQLRADVSAASLAAMIAGAACIAISTVIAKSFPRAHPASTNAVGAIPGVALLLGLSLLAGETPLVPERLEVRIAFAYLVVASVLLFVGFLYVLRRWTASATSYALVLFPIVTITIGALTMGETVRPTFVLGAVLVMAGVYVGALASAPAAAPAPAPARA